MTNLLRAFSRRCFLLYISVFFLTSLGFGTDKLGLIAALSPFAALLGNIIFQRIAKNLEVNVF